MVTGGKLKVKVKFEKPVPAASKDSRPEMETKYLHQPQSGRCDVE